MIKWRAVLWKNGHPSFKQTSTNALHMKSALILTNVSCYLHAIVTYSSIRYINH